MSNSAIVIMAIVFVASIMLLMAWAAWSSWRDHPPRIEYPEPCCDAENKAKLSRPSHHCVRIPGHVGQHMCECGHRW